jgi:hypothetical protein
MRVLLSPYRSRGDAEQLVGLAVRLRARRCRLRAPSTGRSGSAGRRQIRRYVGACGTRRGPGTRQARDVQSPLY